MPTSWFPVLLIVHISLAVSLFLPSILLPFTLRTRRATVDSDSRVVRTLLWAQSNGTVVIGVGLALTGLALVSVLGPQMLQQPWLLVSLATYAITAVVAFAVQRPTLRRLVRRDQIETDEDRARWRDRARRQRYIAYAITTAVGFIAFMMSTKPVLW